MHTFTFTKKSEKIFKGFPENIQIRITDKLTELKTHTNILSILKKLINFEPATHRMRIGSYRLILELTSQTENACQFLILDIGHRKEIYNKS